MVPLVYLKPTLQETQNSPKCIRVIRHHFTQVQFVGLQHKLLQVQGPLQAKITTSAIISLPKREYKHSAINSMILNRRQLPHLQDLKLLQLNSTLRMPQEVDMVLPQRALGVLLKRYHKRFTVNTVHDIIRRLYHNNFIK